MENSERLGRQARPRIELGASRLPILAQNRSATGGGEARTDSMTSMPYPIFEPGTFGVAASSPNHYTAWSARRSSNTAIWNFF